MTRTFALLVTCLGIFLLGWDLPQDGSGAATSEASEPEPEPPTGFLSRDEIRTVIVNRSGEIQGCYEQALVSQPSLEGRIAANFTIGLDGLVVEARTIDDTVGSTVARCISLVLLASEFPPPRGGMVVVTYPFTFRVATGGEAAHSTPAATTAARQSRPIAVSVLRSTGEHMTAMPENDFRPEMLAVARGCADTLFDGDVAHGGSVNFEFTVGQSGLVESPGVVEDTTGVHGFGDCVVEGLGEFVFALPPEYVGEDGLPLPDPVTLQFSVEI